MAGSFTMQKGGFNPFLFEAEEAPQQLVYEPAPASNPFLMDFAPSSSADMQAVPDNPFLTHSMAAVDVAPVYSNPFAEVIDTSQTVVSSMGGWPTSSLESQPQYVDSQMYGNMSGGGGDNVPRSTQDLLTTVTGALDSTSDSLLDRLRMSQPSPLPQPPSPQTPSPVTPDLLGGFDDYVPPTAATVPGIPCSASAMPPPAPAPVAAAPKVSSVPQKPSMDIMDLYQDTSFAPAAPTTAPPVSAVAPSVPPPPAIPQSTFTEAPAPQAVVIEPEPPKIAEYVPPPVTSQPEQPEVTKPIEEAPPAEPEPVRRESFTPERPKPPAVVDKPAKPPPPTMPSRPPPPKPSPPQVAAAPPPVPAQPAPAPPAPVVSPPQPQPTPAPPVPVMSPPQPKILPSNDIKQVPPPVAAPPPTFTQTATSTGWPDKPKPGPVRPGLASATFDSFDRAFDTFEGAGAPETQAQEAWGGETLTAIDESGGLGFDTDDSFLAITEPPPVPQSTPAKHPYGDGGADSMDREDEGLSVVIRPRDAFGSGFGTAPALAPPPKSPAISTGSAFEDSHSFVPFLSAAGGGTRAEREEARRESQSGMAKQDSIESPSTPLFEEDTSQPLEDFPRTVYDMDKCAWEMFMRHPNKKKITGQRFWKKVFVRLVVHNDVPILQVSNNKTDKDPFQEIPLQPCYSVSEIAAQQFDQYGKIFTAKLQYIFYKERVGVRPGQISKAERISTKLSQFAAFAIQGDYQGVKEFGSDLKKLGVPIEHAPQISQLIKLGTQNFEEMKQFSMCIEEALFRLPIHRDRALTYKTEEIQVTMVDEYYVEQDIYGVVKRQIARVRLFFLSFLAGNAEIELGINDMRRQGKEVVGRHDICPIATEEWIRTEAIEFATCVQLDVFENTKMVKFKPPDACYIELLRFRVRPPRQRELPLQVKTTFTTTGHRIEMRCDILVPGFTSRKLGQIPCEDVMVRIPIPETWIYMFRVEKHFRYGSVKSAHRRSGKVKGIERFLGAVEAVENSLMEVTSGQAKYEHQHKAIVWRVSRLPKDGQGAYTTHSFFCHVTLQPHEEIPANLTKHCYVEFTMPHTTVSHTVCRSISVPACDEPPEKCVRYLSRHEYIVEVEHTTGVAPASYNLAAAVPAAPAPAPEPERQNLSNAGIEEKKESDSDFSD